MVLVSPQGEHRTARGYRATWLTASTGSSETRRGRDGRRRRRATHRLDERVAIKFLTRRSATGRDGPLPARGAGGRLRSEHVARVIDVGTLDDGTPYIVMEYLEGDDLRSTAPATARSPSTTRSATCSRRARRSPRRTASASCTATSSRRTSSSRRADGRAPIVKVLDFGISKAVLDDDERHRLTGTADVIGSPRYMSPEQIGARATSTRAPTCGRSASSSTSSSPRRLRSMRDEPELKAILDGAPSRPPTRSRPDAALDKVVMRCLRREKADQFEDAGALRRALDAARRRRPPTITQTSSRSRIACSSRPHCLTRRSRIEKP